MLNADELATYKEMVRWQRQWQDGQPVDRQEIFRFVQLNERIDYSQAVQVNQELATEGLPGWEPG